MKRIAIFVPDLAGGGAERMIVNLANEFAARGLDTVLILAKAAGPYLRLLSAQVRLRDLDIRFGDPRVISRLAAALRSERPGALLTAMTYPNIAGILARRLVSHPFRLVISERVVLTQQSRSLPLLKEKLKPVAARRLYRSADRIVAISNGVAQDLTENIGVPTSQVEVIYNPVSGPTTDEPHPPPNHPAFSNESVPVVIGAGRLVPQKDFATLVRAFAQLRARRIAHLVILGEGPERAALEALAKKLKVSNSVWMPGYVPNPYSYMAYGTVFALSSRWEGFGNVLVEALACGCPVVSTDCPSGPREILGDGTFGRLVRVGDPLAMAQALQEAIDSPCHAEGNRSRARIFSIKAAADAYLHCLVEDKV
ncbi:MAG: glycosyltransferase [Pseudolabrys sp.]